ncbi:MAG: hemerythrin domain-containing protein [Blastocatellia bacterium]|nr:hemerythrin domain-containing protein [Blastocatellia bacterium]
MNALELLIEDHSKVDELLTEAENAESQEQVRLFKQIKEELDAHAHIEETIFYPYMKEHGDEELSDIILEGIEEHRQVKMFLRELDGLAEDSEKFEPKLKVLKEDVEHHVEEEENEMFPMIRDQIEEEALESLGVEMEEEKRKFLKSSNASSGR